MLFRQLDWGSKENENINKRVLKSGQAEKREIEITYINSLFQWFKFIVSLLVQIWSGKFQDGFLSYSNYYLWERV